MSFGLNNNEFPSCWSHSNPSKSPHPHIHALKNSTSLPTFSLVVFRPFSVAPTSPPVYILTHHPNVQVKASARGNLAPPRATLNKQVHNWLNDRWQAARDKTGFPLKGEVRKYFECFANFVSATCCAAPYASLHSFCSNGSSIPSLFP